MNWAILGAMLAARSRLAVVALAVALGLLVAFDPATTWWFPSCPLYALTGWQCPFCGTLRAIHALLRGAPLTALALNPLTIAGLAAWLLARRRVTAFCFSARGLVCLVMFGVVRNIR